ncbi:DUF4351 domain-containing protein [Desulfurispira natronophila]|uniref:SepF-like predicted cell division protein (DUF552 family) n=1 Tax=Desulfurispira natronophila TaxID=682562 RepID=A0A7W7Y4J2_9BACT|nr:DUF4351 domain-containing protein [Desulfurispira natronophila]MBB5021950.1 SepF-like predicted cell division protein (DUF552 family) [Desulfurispira natronophila]
MRVFQQPVSEQDYPDTVLDQMEGTNVVAEIIRIEHSKQTEDLRRNIRRLRQVLKDPIYERLHRIIAIWLSRNVLRVRFKNQQIEEFHDLMEVDAMLAEKIEDWTKEWKDEGRLEGQAKFLHTQIERRFGSVPAEVQDRIHAATEDELARYAINIFDAQSAREVVELSDETTNGHQ